MDNTQEIPDIFKNTISFDDESIVELAEQADWVIQNLKDTYIKGTKIGLEEMDKILKNLPSLSEDDKNDVIKTSFFQIAHDIKGQGTTFGYPLMTALGAHLCNIIRNKEIFSDDDINTFQTDLEDMKTVLNAPSGSDNAALKNISERLKKGS